MSILDKFLDAVKVNDDFDDDDFLDDVDDNFEDEKPKKRFFKKLDDDFDEDDLDDYPPMKNHKKAERQTAAAKAPKQPKQPRQASPASSKVTPIYNVKKKSSSSEVCVIKPKQFDDSTEIVDALLDNCTVILNLEGMDVNLAQHIIDFASGASYSIEGSIRKVSSYIFILTPEGVDITGDSQAFSSDMGGNSMYQGI